MARRSDGIYETDYGNSAVVQLDLSTEWAYDLDSAEVIPMTLVDLSKRVRPMQAHEGGLADDAITERMESEDIDG